MKKHPVTIHRISENETSGIGFFQTSPAQKDYNSAIRNLRQNKSAGNAGEEFLQTIPFSESEKRHAKTPILPLCSNVAEILSLRTGILAFSSWNKRIIEMDHDIGFFQR